MSWTLIVDKQEFELEQAERPSVDVQEGENSLLWEWQPIPIRDVSWDGKKDVTLRLNGITGPEMWGLKQASIKDGKMCYEDACYLDLRGSSNPN